MDVAVMRLVLAPANTDTLDMEAQNVKLTIQNCKEPGRSAVKCKIGNWKTMTNDWNAWRD